MKITSLGYLRVESPDAKEWAAFGTEVLGMSVSEDPLGRPNAVALTIDDRPSRLLVTEGERNRMLAVGWEVPNAAELEAAVAQLESAGVQVTRATDEQRTDARVRDLVSFTDPAGLTHQIYWGPLVEPMSFRPGRAMSGFVSGGQGLGHVVLVVPDLEPAVEFFRDLLGFKVSDEVDMWGTKLVFFHINPRHHTLALIPMPGMRGLHHLMLQVAELDDVGVAHDICVDREIPFAMTLGRHTNDRMLSFYARTPGGFEVEYGWGASVVDTDDDWVVTYMTSPSIWGHRPGTAPAPGCVEPVDGGSGA